MKRLLLTFFLLLSLMQIFAHEVRPAYLELHQKGSDTFDVLWKVPGLGTNMRLGLYVVLPDNCSILGNPRSSMINQAYTERWTIKCTGGLGGKTIRIAGLSATTTDVLVRLDNLDGSVQVTRLTPSAPYFVVAIQPEVMGVASTYIVLGIEHILSGIDHLLFVLALIIITGGGWKLVKTVTAFTVSHTITLTLATLGYIHLPQRPIEAIIALSIVFVAAEILRSRAGKPSFTQRAPWVVAFTFGLMHGLGFASGLNDAGLPVAHIPTALLFFSIGVETGHFLFIGFVLMLTAVLNRASSQLKPIYQKRMNMIHLIPPYIIGTVAMFWVIQRMASF